MASRISSNHLAIAVLFCMLVVLAPLKADDSFPLRNSNFKWASGFWLSPHRQDWNSSDGLKVLAEPDAHRDPKVKTAIQMYGSLWMSQDVPLVPGQYEFSVEVQVDALDDGLIKLICGNDKYSKEQGPTPNSNKQWVRIKTEFEHEGVSPCTLRIQAVRGSCRIRAPRVDIIRLKTSEVPVTNALSIGQIILPPDPHPAESFAAWELQYFLWRMAGSTPGLQGRDAVSPGQTIVIGRAGLADVNQQLEGLESESYTVAAGENKLHLVGNSPRGTLYAVYDFLKTQGCRWVLPGSRGEVIPNRDALQIPVGARTESPDWNVRGFLLHPTLYGQRGEVINVLGNDYFDWAVRNRINAVWHGSGETHDLGAHRGHSHLQRLNHAWYSYLPKDPPEEWAPLINGKREFWHPAGRPNMVCTSNQDYRDRVVSQIIKYFDENPDAQVAACSADDEPAGWCQCETCRSQDGDEGKGPWELQDSGHPKLPMTDRALNFVNEVAARVSKVHPDKLIEMYAYASTGTPPVRERIHPNVLLKVTYFQVSPARSLFEQHPSTVGITDSMNKWQAMGVKNFGLYDYGSFNNIDCPAFWFFLVNNHLKALNERWGMRHYLGETDNTIGPSMMLFNVRAASLWDRDARYEHVLADVCKHYYGVAADEMLEYYNHMHVQMLKWELPEGAPTPFVGDAVEYNVAETHAGTQYLDSAHQKAKGDPLLLGRISIAEFGHAMFTQYIATRRGPDREPITVESMRIASAAHSKVMELWGTNGNYVIDPTRAMLLNWRPEPVLEKPFLTLPTNWEFKTDPEDSGLEAKWHDRESAPTDWSPIRTDNFWTRQDPWKDYRGVGWYRVKFKVPDSSFSAATESNQAGKLRMFFGSVDGRARIFIDGKLIAEQQADPAIMWNKAFAIDLPEDLDLRAEHDLVIQVIKNRFAAGVWKPVIIGHVEQP